MKDIAAVILCAGKGSRMNDDSKNKVCFDWAGVPVIRRIIDNMKAAGVSRFVVVIGHQAYKGYYDRYNYPHAAEVYTASSGSSIIF